ncbi:MAG: hypothetical protein R3E90_08075 [Marinicella sp.]
MFYFPSQTRFDRHRNGFAQNFNQKELVTTGSAQDINPGSSTVHLIPTTG